MPAMANMSTNAITADHQPDPSQVSASGRRPRSADATLATGRRRPPGAVSSAEAARMPGSSRFAGHPEQVVDLAIVRALPADRLEHRVRLAVVARGRARPVRTSTGCPGRAPGAARERCRPARPGSARCGVELADALAHRHDARPLLGRGQGPQLADRSPISTSRRASARRFWMVWSPEPQRRPGPPARSPPRTTAREPRRRRPSPRRAGCGPARRSGKRCCTSVNSSTASAHCRR